MFSGAGRNAGNLDNRLKENGFCAPKRRAESGKKSHEKTARPSRS